MSLPLLLRSLLIAALALLMAAAVSGLTLYERVELWLGDAQHRLVARDLGAAQALVVDIDEESLRRLEPYVGVWPYRRDVFALVLDYLGEMGVRVVCFDVLMSERRPGDAQLAQAVERNPETVFAALAVSDARDVDRSRRVQLDRLSWPIPGALKLEAWAGVNLPVFADAANPFGGVGVASLWPDLDGSVRRVPLFHQVQGAVLPGLALATVLGGKARPRVEFDPERGELQIGGKVWPVDADGRATLNFPRNGDAVQTLPFHSLVLAAMGAAAAPLAADALKGKTVIIGSTALQADIVQTPRGLMPGPYLLALAYENLAAGRLLRPSRLPTTALLLLLTLAVPLLWAAAKPTSPGGIVATLLAGAAIAVGANLALLAVWQQQSPLLFALVSLLGFAAGQGVLVAKAELVRRRHAERQMQIAAAVFEASRDGIIVTDAANDIVSVNPAFTRITGYTADEAIGRNPRLLSSGRHGADFRAGMWRSILEQGYWQGEIWNRRKDGEVYPQWLSINTVLAPDGAVDKRIAIFSDLSAHKAAEERIGFLAHFDPLTGLPNRTLLRDRVGVALAAAARAQTTVTLMFIDLDRFKNIVDSLGHDVGDLMLQQVAARLQALLGDGDTASRHGGDEFILLLPGYAGEAAAHLADRILASLARPFQVAGHELALTASIGIAAYPEDGADHDALLRSADSALHRAKRAGRNTFQFYTAEMHARAHELLLLENSLRHAVVRNELVLHYQPQVAAATGKLVGVEALLRWQHPTRGLVAPADFIPVAEECGMIVDIGDWVLRSALAQVREWADAGLPVVPVAVNLSLAQFRQAGLCDRLVAALQGSGLAAGLLELELTESVAMEDIGFTLGAIERMRELGVGLSIDDFGTGYSSLSYLKRFAVSKIKIDQSFVRNLGIDNEDASIVRAIISLAHNLGFKVIAEGVETAAQLAFLRSEGCDEIQGFHFSRPLPAAELPAILRRGLLQPERVTPGDAAADAQS